MGFWRLVLVSPEVTLRTRKWTLRFSLSRGAFTHTSPVTESNSNSSAENLVRL